MEKCKYKQKKIKIENLIDEDLEKSESTESDSDSNDETKWIIYFDNNKSLIVCVNHALSGLYFCQSV